MTKYYLSPDGGSHRHLQSSLASLPPKIELKSDQTSSYLQEIQRTEERVKWHYDNVTAKSRLWQTLEMNVICSLIQTVHTFMKESDNFALLAGYVILIFRCNNSTMHIFQESLNTYMGTKIVKIPQKPKVGYLPTSHQELSTLWIMWYWCRDRQID